VTVYELIARNITNSGLLPIKSDIAYGLDSITMRCSTTALEEAALVCVVLHKTASPLKPPICSTTK